MEKEESELKLRLYAFRQLLMNSGLEGDADKAKAMESLSLEAEEAIKGWKKVQKYEEIKKKILQQVRQKLNIYKQSEASDFWSWIRQKTVLIRH